MSACILVLKQTISDYNMATPVRRNAMRATMPHVVTQWETGQWLREGIEPKRPRANSEYLKPVVHPTTERKSLGLRPKMGLNFPGTPESNLWDFGSIRHIKQSSTEMQTPVSAVNSIFELPCNEPHKSPNSSTHSSFIAELEDTSPVVVHKRLLSPASSTSLSMPPSPAHPKGLHLRDQRMEVKGDGSTPRAVIMVVDEKIAAIEETNRKLLDRAVAAEETAKLLRVQNSQLQLRIKHCSQTHHRPKTAPSQAAAALRFHHRHTDSTHDPTPLSSFNSTTNELVLDKPKNPKRKPRPPPPYPPARTAPYISAQPLTPPSHVDLAPNPFTKTGFGQSSARRPPPLTLRHMNSGSHINDISSPIPGSVMRHDVTFDGTPISFSPRAKHITLDEARRRAKPLPPLGPINPNVVKGAVELDCPHDESDMYARDFERKKCKVFSGLFKREKKKDFR